MEIYRDPRELRKEHAQFPFSSHYEEITDVWSHYHKMIEILYLSEGELNVFLGNNLYKMNEGDLVIINSGEVHRMYSKSVAKYIVVQVEPEFLYTSDKTASKIRYVYPFLQLNSANPRILKKEDVCQFDARSIMHDILTHCTDMDYGFELSVKGDIYKLFFGILRHLKQNGAITDITDKLEPGTVDAFDMVVEYINENFAHNITVKDVSKIAKLSYSYFSRWFNLVMNTGFSEYLTAVRISKSEQLLIDTDKSITEIAYECGFSTSSYFTMKFKEKNKIPPLGFRKKFGLGR